VHVNEETIIGMLRKGVSPTLVRSKFYVRINEEDDLPRRPISATLVNLMDMAAGIIALFDY
jgi:hypothetical protein